MTVNAKDIKKSALYHKHLELTSKTHLAEFAGYLMPLWYSSISQEHQVVRETAGLFDCTHMGVWQVRGQSSEKFLDLITTNRVTALQAGQAHYSYILEADGTVLDDIIIYRRGPQDFMVVVNAANNSRIDRWFKTVPEILSQYGYDLDPEIWDMRDMTVGDDARVDIALQGPRSCDILLNIVSDKDTIKELSPFSFVELKIDEIDVLVSRTGYTGARTGYELFVHPENAPWLWDVLLRKGEPLGLQPCGLGARDSLRIEAGLPLYGHELAGRHNISPFEAGYGWAVKLDKNFFLGQEPMRIRKSNYTMSVQRLKLPGQKGIRPVREGDAVLDNTGKCIGWILSCARVDQVQIALAFLRRDSVDAQGDIGVYYRARNERHIEQGRKKTIKEGAMLDKDIVGTVIERMARF
ncbi:MAG: glycine cleavage system aminomethyltransferase GcvT [Sedimentisphaerales bacterium]|nr:glycine cleavage system aminomethyltransferase GcvT [Sedimentisphaerales bacterium]